MEKKLDRNLINKLTSEQEEIVLKEVGYTRKQLSSDLKLIREWLNDQHHLPPSRLKESDSFLEYYLTGCKGSLETVKRKLDNYYTVRSHSKILQDRDPESDRYLAIRDLCDITHLPYSGVNGERLFIAVLKNYDTETLDFETYIKIYVNRCEVFMRMAGLGSRCYLLIDCKETTADIFFRMKATVFKDLVFILEEVYPFRYIKIVYANVPAYIDVVVNNVIKPLLSKKLKERFFVTDEDHKDLLNFFTPEALPSDYGGVSTNPTLQELRDRWVKEEIAQKEWFINELSEQVDETKRINVEQFNKNPFFGVHGSLKKLEID